MGAGGAQGCVSAGGVPERDGGGARDHLGETAEANARCACDAGARAQAGDCGAEGDAGGTCAEEKVIMPLGQLNSRRSPSSCKACVQRGPRERTASTVSDRGLSKGCPRAGTPKRPSDEN